MDVVAPKRSPVERKAFKMWCAAGRPRQTKWIADELGVSPEMIRKWKHYYRWDELEDPRPGAPRGNKNAVGNKGGAPKGNANAVKHGLYRKFMPQDEEFLEIYDMVADGDPLDMLWHNITLQYAAIIRAQKIMFVKDRDEMIKELKKRKRQMDTEKVGKNPDGTNKYETYESYIEEEWEFQFAWDRYATYLKAQADAIRALNASIRQFMNAAPENDERRAKLELMQAQVEKVRVEVENAKGGGKNADAEDWVSALKEAAERRRTRQVSDDE